MDSRADRIMNRERLRIKLIVSSSPLLVQHRSLFSSKTFPKYLISVNISEEAAAGLNE